MDQLTRMFAHETLTTVSNQIKASERMLTKKYFSKPRFVPGELVMLNIRRGAAVVLNSIARDAVHVQPDHARDFKITAQLPRFALSSTLTAADLNTFNTIKDDMTRAMALKEEINNIYEEHRMDLEQTIEYMATGAIFGRVVDGSGRVLFELENKSPQKQLTATKKLLDLKFEIDKAMNNELGFSRVNYTILASPKFLRTVHEKCVAEDLFSTNQAASMIGRSGDYDLEFHGVKVVGFNATYRNEQGKMLDYIPDGEAVAIPDDVDIFKFIYGAANHIKALGAGAQLIFNPEPEPLPAGRGFLLISECRPLLYCDRPQALVKLKVTE